MQENTIRQLYTEYDLPQLKTDNCEYIMNMPNAKKILKGDFQ